MGYWIQNIVFNLAFLFLDINIEITKNNTSFLDDQDIYRYSNFLIVSIALNVAQVLSHIFIFIGNFSEINFNYTIFFTISLVTPIFFQDLSMSLRLCCINNKDLG